jgi:hypothetical protein
MNKRETLITVGIVIAIATFATSVFAGTDKGTGEVCRGSTCNGGSQNGSNTQGQEQAQGQAQGQLQGQLQGQAQRADSRSRSRSQSASTSVSNSSSSAAAAVTSSQASTVTGGDVSVTVAGSTFSSPERIRNTPDAFAVAPMPSATCVVTGSAGVAVPGFGGSVSGGTVDAECQARENARLLMSLGRQNTAVRVLCEASASVARQEPDCADLAKEHADRARKAQVSPGPQSGL